MELGALVTRTERLHIDVLAIAERLRLEGISGSSGDLQSHPQLKVVLALQPDPNSKLV